MTTLNRVTQICISCLAVVYSYLYYRPSYRCAVICVVWWRFSALCV